MRVAGFLTICAVALLLAGCEDQSVSRAKKWIESDLKDPSSIQYRDVRPYGTQRQYVCGEFNAKNSFGAYTGYRRFVWDGERVIVDGEGKTLPDWLCR